MSQTLLATAARSASSRRRPQTPAFAAPAARPETDRVLREVAFVCRLTERVKEAVVGRKATPAAAGV
jgi:hypothetical protein